MKDFTKAVFGGLLMAGAGLAGSVPAYAGVGVSVNLGLFGPPAPPPPAYVMPGYCDNRYYYAACGYQVWGEPVFWNGYWYNNAQYRIVRGHREFWVHGGWHEVAVRGGPRRGFDRR